MNGFENFTIVNCYIESIETLHDVAKFIRDELNYDHVESVSGVDYPQDKEIEVVFDELPHSKIRYTLKNELKEKKIQYLEKMQPNYLLLEIYSTV